MAPAKFLTWKSASTDTSYENSSGSPWLREVAFVKRWRLLAQTTIPRRVSTRPCTPKASSPISKHHRIGRVRGRGMWIGRRLSPTTWYRIFVWSMRFAFTPSEVHIAETSDLFHGYCSMCRVLLSSSTSFFVMLKMANLLQRFFNLASPYTRPRTFAFVMAMPLNHHQHLRVLLQ